MVVRLVPTFPAAFKSKRGQGWFRVQATGRARENTEDTMNAVLMCMYVCMYV